MRGGDACELAFSPMVDDSVGWPCLRFANSKVSEPSSSSLSAPRRRRAIRAQQAHDRAHAAPGGIGVAVPRDLRQRGRCQALRRTARLSRAAGTVADGDRRARRGRPAVRDHAHQFRHTVGTRLINAGVPQHVIQKLLGHASPRMTARYAQIHDHTVRDAFERYCRQRVNTDGDRRALRPRRPHGRRRVGQAQPLPGARQPAQRLLRPAASAGLPAPQRLPHLPGLPDDPGVPRHPPPPRRRPTASSSPGPTPTASSAWPRTSARSRPASTTSSPSLEALEGTGPTP